VQAPSIAGSTGREIQIGGPDALSYGEMLDRMAAVLNLRRRPRVPVPFITPWLSSLWIGLITPVDAGVARPLVEGRAAPASGPPVTNSDATTAPGNRDTDVTHREHGQGDTALGAARAGGAGGDAKRPARPGLRCGVAGWTH
jgi:hypothetical protein